MATWPARVRRERRRTGERNYWKGVHTGVPHCAEGGGQLTSLPSGAQSASVVHGSTQAGPPEPQSPSAAIAENVMQTKPWGHLLSAPASPPSSSGTPASGPHGVSANGGELEHAGKPARMATSTGIHVFIVVVGRRLPAVHLARGPGHCPYPSRPGSRKEAKEPADARGLWPTCGCRRASPSKPGKARRGRSEHQDKSQSIVRFRCSFSV